MVIRLSSSPSPARGTRGRPASGKRKRERLWASLITSRPSRPKPHGAAGEAIKTGSGEGESVEALGVRA